MATFVEKWGMAVAKRRHTQLPDLLMDYWREVGLSRTERDNLFYIIRYQDDPEYRTIPSAKELAKKSGVCYETTRANLKRLTEHKKNGGKGLLTPVILSGGRIRYSTMALRRELEKIDELQRQGQPLEVVKPARPRPVPKPAPIVTIVPPDPDAWVQKEWAEIDENAYADWEEIKEQISEEVSEAAYKTWIEPTHGLYRDSNEVLWIEVPSSSHEEQLLGRFAAIIERLRKLYGIASIACRVMLAATLGGG